jgi:hypothetical protein
MYIKGFDIIRKDRGNLTRGGVAIIFKNRLKYQRMKNLYNCEGKLKVCAISVYAVGYRPPDKRISEESWTKFFNQNAGNYLIIKNSIAIVCKQTILTERPPLVGEVSSNLCR